MKKFFFLLIIYVLAILPQLKAQVQLDTLKTKKEDVLPKMRLDTLIRIPNAKPIFRKDTGGFENKEKSAPVLKGGEATGSMMMATTEDVGKTPVYIDVSPSGAAIASIPINIPKGINGFTPEVSLVYNSQGGNGVAGYGWGIGGLSSISRIPATKFHNSRIGGINLDMNDFFALDGQRLLLKTGTYGHPNAEYQTENYANLRIFSRGSVPIGSNTGPDYFEVWYPDGSKAFYGATNSSKTVIEYGVTYRESNLGARINYAYASTNNTLKLLQINYGTLGTGQGINTINFSYETAQRSEQAYVAGQNIYRDFILNKISVGVNGTSLRHYNVETNAMNLIGYQRLDGLLETNGDETKSLGRIYFSYEISSDITYSSTVSNLSLSQIASNNSDAVFGDFTGSGTMDFILRPTAKNKFWTFFDLEPGSAYMQFGYEVNTGYYKEVFPIKWLTQNSKLLSGDGFAVVKDLYGSYKFDILSRGTTAPVYFQYDRLWNAPRAWGYYSECDNLHHDGPILNQEFISGDFNGDGLTDIMAINRPYYNLVTYERLEEGNPWDPDPPVTPLVSLRPPPVGNCVQEYGNMDYSQVHLINLDRRITTNFAANIGYLNKSYTVGDKLYTGDFNGDGKTDIIHVANGIMYVYGLNDNNYLQLLWQENDTRISLNEEILLGDYNGDGKTDLMFSTTTSFQYALFMSKGNGFKKHTQMLP